MSPLQESIEIALIGTLEAILNEATWDDDPRSILKIVDFLPRTNRFEFRLCFDSRNDNILKISTSPQPSLEEISTLLSGRFSNIFFSDELHFRLPGTTGSHFFLKIPDDTLCRSSLNFAHHRDDLDCDVLIKGFHGNQIPVVLQNKIRIRDYLINRTRFGSHLLANQKIVVEWKILANSHVFESRSRLLNHSTNEALSLGPTEFVLKASESKAVVCVSENLETSFFHSRYGEFFLPSAVGRSKSLIRKDLGIYVEILDDKLCEINDMRLAPKSRLENIMADLFTELEDWKKSSSWIEYMEENEKKNRRLSAIKLRERQEATRGTKFVYRGYRRLFRVPTCENELVALWMKLSAIDDDLDGIRIDVMEYTSREGIDALADIRWSDEEAMEPVSPVEFEMLLENFFTHEHPIEQVKTIICWDTQLEPGTTVRGDFLIEGTERDFVFRVIRGEYSARVILLARWPEIEVQEYV